MTGWLHVAASAGVFLACAAIVAFAAVTVFGDLFIKSDDVLRKTMDAILFTILAAVAVVAFTTATVVYRLCPLTPRTGIWYNDRPELQMERQQR